MLGVRSLGTVGNRIAGHGVSVAVEQVFAGALPAVRERLGLPRTSAVAAWRARERQGRPVLHGFSPLVVPRPDDWRPGLSVTGYWWPYDADTQLPPPLRDFLDAGPPPVYVGLGSATVPDPDRLSIVIVRALRRAGLRGVIQRGWAGLDASGDDMLTIDDVPHSVLFPARPPWSTTRARARQRPVCAPEYRPYRCRSSSTRASGPPAWSPWASPHAPCPCAACPPTRWPRH